jgi:neutral ceramidase
MNAPKWKAGAAATVITPAEPMWLAGWAARRQPSTGKAMDLSAKALAFEDPDGERAVIVTADLIAVPRELVAAVAARISERRHIPRERLLFNASHTHTGPEVRPDKIPFFEIPPEYAVKIAPYVSQLADRIAAVIELALDRLQPSILHVYQVHAGFAANRRSPSGPVDHDVPMLVVRRGDGNSLAFLFGYACHNLTLPPAYCEFHGDYAGVAQNLLEARFPGAIALFLAGAGGDQDPAPRGTTECARLHGETLADGIQQGMSNGGRAVSGSLRVAFETVALDLLPLQSREKLAEDTRSSDPPLRRKAEYLLSAFAEKRSIPTNHLCPVQVLRFGNELLLVALGGEPVVAYAQRFKREFAGPLVWVAGYSNDMFGYLPTRKVQEEGGYEGGRATLWSALPAPLAETAEERVVETVHRLVRQVRNSASLTPR